MSENFFLPTRLQRIGADTRLTRHCVQIRLSVRLGPRQNPGGFCGGSESKWTIEGQ
jgi:hypothetical protein